MPTFSTKATPKNGGLSSRHEEQSMKGIYLSHNIALEKAVKRFLKRHPELRGKL